MARPKCCRNIWRTPERCYFEPRGITGPELEEVTLSLDEFEAVRLADFNGFYQEDAAGRMNISRQTFGRIIESAHKKIADSLVNGKALKIEGGEIAIKGKRHLRCPKCKKTVDPATGSASDGKEINCPRCGNTSNNKKCNNNRRKE